jgi:cyclopropane-fatty-acyl-phospholipid synthase
MSAGHATVPLSEALAQALPERPFRVELWDGSTLPPTNGAGGPTFRVRSPRALGHVLRAPGQLGLGRAYVSGDIEVDDIEAVLELLDRYTVPSLHARDKARLAAAAVRAGGLRSVPRAPAAELRPRGRLHSRERDRRAVTHHYDVSNEFFRLFLGESMTYSCAVFSRGAQTLEEAQHAKLELVCTKLGLRAGARVLDVGCGWGSFALHAAGKHGVHVTGITLSKPQAALARERAAAAGLADRIDIRVADYRDLAGEQFEAIASIGMVEHVGGANVDGYARQLASVLRPGGRLLNHGIARLRHGDPEAGPFSERFVFPDAAPLHLSRVLAAIEATGLEPTHVEGFRLDYARTLREWARNLDEHAERAEALAGPERMRVWRLYLRAARRGFVSGFSSIFQVVAHRPQGPVEPTPSCWRHERGGGADEPPLPDRRTLGRTRFRRDR